MLKTRRTFFEIQEFFEKHQFKSFLGISVTKFELYYQSIGNIYQNVPRDVK